MASRLIALLIPVALLAAACGPIPVAEAERSCAADYAPPPPPIRGRAEAGISNGNAHQGYEIEFAPSVTFGDPSAQYIRCVVQASGQYPTRPLHELAPS
jgi:hypothetical protein